MDNNEKTSEKITKWLLVGISVLFLAVMLLLPLITVITEALRSGWKVYAAAVTDEYTIKALLLTVKATLFAVVFNTVFGVFAAWALTKFQFRGKKLLTTLIDLPVTISPVIAGLIFLLIFGRQSPVYFFLMRKRPCAVAAALQPVVAPNTNPSTCMQPIGRTPPAHLPSVASVFSPTGRQRENAFLRCSIPIRHRAIHQLLTCSER